MKRQEFMKKMAQAGLSDEDQKALMEFVKAQKADAAKKAVQKKMMRAQNRADRVFNAKTALTIMLGLGGGMLGGEIGKRFGGPGWGVAGGLGGAVAGGIGGNLLGRWVGNRSADRMEEEEDRTGVSVFDQNHRNMTRQLNNWYMFDRHGPGGLGYSLLTR